MKKTAIGIFVVSLIYFLSTSTIYAYGGGPGLPSGFLFSQVKLTCEQKPLDFSFIKIRVPICKLVRIDENQKDVKNRWQDFMKRVENGGD